MKVRSLGLRLGISGLRTIPEATDREKQERRRQGKEKKGDCHLLAEVGRPLHLM